MITTNVNLCIPVLNSYDLLEKEINSANNGTIVPNIYIIDNGGKFINKWKNVKCYRPGSNIGLAKAWNIFINTISEYRIISNDDIIFDKDSIQKLIENYDENYIVTPNVDPQYACFMIPDNIVKNVGYFDENISPNYAYFEDTDYDRRLKLKGYDTKIIEDYKVQHLGSSTLKQFTNQETIEHHIKFNIARYNYIRKWGGVPGYELFPFPSNQMTIGWN